MTVTGSTVRKRSVIVAGHRTSISLEQELWEELHGIAQAQGVSLNRLVTEIDVDRPGSLSSALRVFVLKAVKQTS